MISDADEAWTRLDPVDALHVSVSLSLLTNDGSRLQVLMRENHEGPYTNRFVLPHQIMSDELTLEETARELCASFDLVGVDLEQISAFSCPRIDPRSRVLTVGFAGAVPRASLEWVSGRNDLALIDVEMDSGFALLSFGGMPIPAGFMHDEVVGCAVEQLRMAADYSTMMFDFVPEVFTFAELHAAHEAISGKAITPQWLRRKLLKRVYEGDRMIVGKKALRRDGPCRPAELFELLYVDPALRRAAQRRALNKKRNDNRESSR